MNPLGDRPGLSPRLRGNLDPDRPPGADRHWVYPRACGGTEVAVEGSADHGLTVYPRACGGTQKNLACPEAWISR